MALPQHPDHAGNYGVAWESPLLPSLSWELDRESLLGCAYAAPACPLGPVDLEAAADGGGDGLQIVWV